MYSWGDTMDDWARPGAYRFDSARAAVRARDAARAAKAGPRSYDVSGPDMARVDPRKHLHTESRNPLVVAVDVTGSMAHWPFEIFDRLPLLSNTLTQYRPDLEVSFAAIGDAGCDRWPLQVTRFAQGYDLEEELKALYGEGGGGDEPESYGLFAAFMATHAPTPKAEGKPFLIVFGDAHMHELVPKSQVAHLLGDRAQRDLKAQDLWRSVCERWNVWFLRRAGKPGDSIDKQWGAAIGSQHILHIHDEPRAVDYAMGLVARAWGHFGDFRSNMAARQEESDVRNLETRLEKATRRLSA